MKIVIDVDEMTYYSSQITADIDGSPVLKAIKNGVVLPKNHGKLVDADEISRTHEGNGWDLHKVLKRAKAIIEAEREDKHER